MFLDLHVHTSRYSECSNLDPQEMLKAARLLKLDGLVITEHGILWDKEEIEALKRYPEAEGLIILRGQEVYTYQNSSYSGDVLVFGAEKSIDKKLSPEELIIEVHSQGGVIVAAHPYRFGLGLADRMFNLNLDGIEVLNGNTSVDGMRQAQDAQQILQIAGTGGSDAHSADALGNYLTFFPDKITTEAELVAAIRDKKCRPAYYEELLTKNG